MKKTCILFLFILTLSLIGCNTTPASDSETEPQTSNNNIFNETELNSDSEIQNTQAEDTEDECISDIIKPLDSTINITNLVDGTYSVFLEEDAFYTDENGNIQVVVTIYDFDLYHAKDIENLTLNDSIEILDETITITSLETTPFGNIIVNGGFEVGGFDFTTKDGSYYFITGASDTKAYYEIGLATLPVASGFEFYDEMDNTLEPFSAEDFLVEETEFFYAFSQYNTTIEVKDGSVIKMTRIYTP